MLAHTAHPDDVLLWSDSFWCYRHEHCDEFKCDELYREVLRFSEEWNKVLNSPFPPTYKRLVDHS